MEKTNVLLPITGQMVICQNDTEFHLMQVCTLQSEYINVTKIDW